MLIKNASARLLCRMDGKNGKQTKTIQMKRETKNNIYLVMIIIATVAILLLVLSELGIIN